MTTDSTLPADFDLLDYIKSGTIAKREVALYADERAGEELVALIAQLKDLGWSEEGQDEKATRPKDGPLDATSDETDIADLLEKARSAQERLDSSKSVWTVQAISPEVADAALESIKDPKAPIPPKEGAAERVKEAYQDRYVEYRKGCDVAERDRRLVLLSEAIISVETPNGTSSGVSIDHLKALRQRAGGQKWIDKLWSGLNEAQSEDPDVPRPTWLARSTDSLE